MPEDVIPAVQTESVPDATDGREHFIATKFEDLTAAPAKEPEQEPEPVKDTPAVDASPEPVHKSNRVQNRIDRLTREKNDAARERDALKQELAAAKAAKEPNLTDFADYADYETARDAWRDANAQTTQQPEKPANRWEEREVAEALKEVQSTFDDAKAKYADFDAVIEKNGSVVTPDMIKILAECDDPGDAAYYLCSNTDEAERIAQLNPLQQAKAIGKIEAKLSIVPQKPIKKQSNAPAPIRPVGIGSKDISKPYKDQSFAEFEAVRNKERKAMGGW